MSGNDASIQTSKGHPFWVNGAGWKMAKKLQAGDQLHSMHGPIEITAVDELTDEKEVYNLVVAGTGTYFVGPQAILVHDNTYRAATQCAVPGLK